MNWPTLPRPFLAGAGRRALPSVADGWSVGVRLYSRGRGGGRAAAPPRKPARMLLSKDLVEPTVKQKAKLGGRGDVVSRQRAQAFKIRQTSTPRLAGPPNAAAFGALKNIKFEDRLPQTVTASKLDTFEALRLLPEVREAVLDRALGHLETKRPSAIQALAIQRLTRVEKEPAAEAAPHLVGEHDLDTSKFQSFLVAAETGSGKTLAYLAPLMSLLKQEEAAGEWDREGTDNYLRAVVLVPTAELVEQVSELVKNMTHVARLSSASLSQETSFGVSKNLAAKKLDVLVSTPVPLLKVLHRRGNSQLLKHTRYIVVDEADSLMDRSFKGETEEVLSYAHQLRKVIFCSATIPKNFDRNLRNDYPNMVRVVAPHVHQVPRRVHFVTVNASVPPYHDDKRKALMDLLYSIDKDNAEPDLRKRVIVFLNKREDVEPLAKFLEERKVTVDRLTRDSPLAERCATLRHYTDSPQEMDREHVAPGSLGALRVLVTTDLVSRGIDMNSIRNVILFDVPFSSIDLIHRAGRTGRMGRRGRAYLITVKKEDKPWLRGLARTVNRGQALV
ncbi:P-loop containing nucleoside triphosphate hydrolase protein [Dipodascopsis tothii]|uniref:P-loop containing nucleoside triphosphate hydrolase protein n=1 Tax=Dipodascopsis tothii TaxID=44089 RepID=UPI0034CEC5BA